MSKRLALSVVLFIASMLVVASPAYSQHSRRDRSSEGQRGQRAVPRRHDPVGHEYAVPRNRPLPRPHPESGAYHRGFYEGHYFLWRHYPPVWYGSGICVQGYWDWDWDEWSNSWVPVWVEGYCNIRGYRPPRVGFFFWF